MQQNGVSGGRWELHHSAIRKRLDEVWGCSFEDYYKTITSASPNAPPQSPTKMATVSPVKGMDVCRLKPGRSSVSESCRSTPNGKWRGAAAMAENGSRKRVARMDASGRTAKKPRDEIGLMLEEFTSLPPLLSPLRVTSEVTSLHPTTAQPQPSPKPQPKPAVKKELTAVSKAVPLPNPTIVNEPAAAHQAANDKVSSSKPAPGHKSVVSNGKIEEFGVTSIVSSTSSKRLNGDARMSKALGTCNLDITCIPRERRKVLFERWKLQGAEKAPHRRKSKPEEIERTDGGSKSAVKAAATANNESKKMKMTEKPIPETDSRSVGEPEKANKVEVVEIVEAASQPKSNTVATVSATESKTPSLNNGVHPRSLGEKPLSRAPTDEVMNEESTPQFKFSLEEAVEERKRTSEGYRGVARTTKHRADKTPDRTEKTLLYLEATLYFALSAIAERGVDAEKSTEKAHSTQNKRVQPQQQQSYLPLSRSLDFLRSSTSTFANSKPDSPHMRRYRRRVKFFGSLLDACLSYQLYRLRSEEAYQNYNLLKEKRAEKSSCAVAEKHEATPHPASTSSSSIPASEVKSEVATTASKDMVQLPSSVHQLLLRQNQILTHLLWAHRLWDEANSTATDENKGLLLALDALCGELKLDSDVPHLVNFFGTATKWMQRQYGNELKKLAAAGDAEAAPP